MKKYLMATAAAFAVTASAGYAGENSVFALGSYSEDDQSFAMLSYRHVFDQGFILRFDVTSANYDVGAVRVSRTGQRAVLGYRFASGGGATTFYLGAASDKVAGVRNEGAFAAIEHYQELANGDTFFGSLEYNDASEGTYAGAHYGFDLGAVKLGPALSYFHVTDYEHVDLGVRASFDVGNGATLISTLSGRRSEATGTPKNDSAVFDLGIYFSF